VRRIVLGVIVLVLAGTAGTAVAVRWAGRGPSRPSVGKAIERFRTSSPALPLAHALQPPAGVYVYRGSGHERLSFMNTRQSQGPTEPGTVTILPTGCWSFEIDFNSYHSQTWVRCALRAQLLEQGGTADQKFDFVAFKQREHSATTCVPSAVVADGRARAGDQRTIHCTVHSQTTHTDAVQTGTVTFVGREAVNVGGHAVAALHTHEEMHLSGGQTGTVTVDVWFAQSNGLPLREQHAIRVVSSAPAPINHVTYSETGTWQLTSLTPHR
jgi:hypothetical protein